VFLTDRKFVSNSNVTFKFVLQSRFYIYRDLFLIFYFVVVNMWGHAVAQLVEALRCKPEGRGFDSRWCH